MKIKINAKVNLALDIVGVREDGYHLLDMVMASVNIGDIMECHHADGIEVVMDGALCGSENIAYRTIEVCMAEGLIDGMRVNIAKGIPISSGMGGSSCDSAGVLYAAAKLYGVNEYKLMTIANRIGSDIAFLYHGGVSRVGGKGEIIQPMPYKHGHMVIAMGKHGALTSSVFKQYDKSGAYPTNYASVLAKSWGNEGISIVGNGMSDSAIVVNQEIKFTIDTLRKFSDKVTMSGSGAGVVAVFKNKELALKCLEAIKDKMYFATYAEFARCGIEEIN